MLDSQSPLLSPRIFTLARLSQWVALTAIGVGMLVLLGWTLDIGVLKSLSPRWVTMKANTALAFVLCGAALWGRVTERGCREQPRPEKADANFPVFLPDVAAALVAVIGVLTLAQYLFGISLGIDQLLFTDSRTAVGTAMPGRMSPATAFSFLLLGSALLLMRNARAFGAVQACALTAGTIGFFSLLGYLYSVKPLYTLQHDVTSIAFHTAAVIVILMVGILAVPPQRGLVAILASKSAGGVMARRLLPLAILIPFLIGIGALVGQRQGLYGVEFGLALVILVVITTMTALLVWNARDLHRMDLQRERDEEALRRAYDELEVRVLERTRELRVSNEQLAAEVVERQHAQAVLGQQSQELQRSNAELEQFAYVASHDLQEPLRMVTNYLQLLRQRYQGRLGSDADEFIEFAVDGAKRMQGLISDLLAFSRIGSRGEFFQSTDCNAVLATALNNLQETIRESGARITHDPLPVTMADTTQLTQLFQNLIANAIKFRADQPPQIHVRVQARGGFWQFAFEDNGIGIAPEYFERIFVLFQRLHGRLAYPGTGIGLAICKKVVERHSGRIWVESACNQGSVFYFTLPKLEHVL